MHYLTELSCLLPKDVHTFWFGPHTQDLLLVASGCAMLPNVSSYSMVLLDMMTQLFGQSPITPSTMMLMAGASRLVLA